MSVVHRLLLCLVVLSVAVMPTPAIAESVAEGVLSPAGVVDLGAEADGTTVTVSGEAIGEALRAAGGGTWVNVLGDGVALGLWGEPELFEPVREFGGYHMRGAIVEASGVYNAACDTHGGDRDVHVESLRVVEAGRRIDRPLKPWKIVAGLTMAGGAGVLWLRYRRRASRAF